MPEATYSESIVQLKAGTITRGAAIQNRSPKASNNMTTEGMTLDMRAYVAEDGHTYLAVKMPDDEWYKVELRRIY